MANLRTEKVIEHVIHPMEIHFGIKPTEALINDYAEDLGEYTAETLQSAMKALRRESTRRPSLSDIIQKCDALKPRSAQSNPKDKPSGFHCTGKAEQAHPDIARQIMESPAGQYALSLGIGKDLLTTYEVTGQREFDRAFVNRMKRAWDEAVSNITSTGPLDLEGIYNAMRDREKNLHAKYFRRAA